MRPVRILATLALVTITAGAAAACKAADALSTQEVVVHFVPGAPESEHVRVQQTCGLVPHVSPLPIPANQNSAQMQTDVHFLVKPGSGQNMNRLIACLSGDQFKGVVLGYDAPGM